ncbi:MAG: peroxiredoxin, partial [Sphingomicrobium sp.]
MRLILTALSLAMLAAPAAAALLPGAKAPNFVTQGAVAGKAFQLSLTEQLKHGPVVLYFYPKAFTKGCTLEANAFSEAMPAFKAAGARVIGLSADTIDTLKKFSVEACRSAFPVARADAKVIKAYDVALPVVGMSNRTSYVIARDGRIVMVHSEMDWK